MAKVLPTKKRSSNITTNNKALSQPKLDKTATNIKSIIEIFRKEGKDINELEFKNKEFKIRLTKQPQQIINKSQANDTPTYQVPSLTPNPAPIPTEANSDLKDGSIVSNNNLFVVKSPMVGTFYRKPSPDKKPFVEEGTTIKKGQTIGIIEAMKLFNEIEAEVQGHIVEVFANDGDPVEFDQPLMTIEKA